MLPDTPLRGFIRLRTTLPEKSPPPPPCPMPADKTIKIFISAYRFC
jgi:hypothetical protein